MVDEVEDNRLQLVQLQHPSHLVYDLQFSLYSQLGLKGQVQIDDIVEYLVHELEVGGKGQFEFLQQFDRHYQQFLLHYAFVCQYLLGHPVDPSTAHTASQVVYEQYVSELVFPGKDLVVLQVKQLLDFVLGLYKFGHFGTPVPLVHQLDDPEVSIEGNLLEIAVDIPLIDESLKRYQFALGHHAVLADGDVVSSFLVFGADLVLVYTLDFHVHKLIASGFLEHANYFRNIQDLVFDEKGESLVDRLPAFNFDGGHWFDRFDFFPHLLQIYTLVNFFLNCQFGGYCFVLQ